MPALLDATYTLAAVTTTSVAPSIARPLTQPPVPASLMHAFAVSRPDAGSRSKTCSESEAGDAAYAERPSGEIARWKTPSTSGTAAQPFTAAEATHDCTEGTKSSARAAAGRNSRASSIRGRSRAISPAMTAREPPCSRPMRESASCR